jgi:holliday junction DNA helicase RuvA
MIAQLTGTVAGVRRAHVVVDVHGVGYLVAVRRATTFKHGEIVTLHTHLAVRENALDLYGFLLLDELSMFEELIKLPKIGPKSAMQILTQADVPLLIKAISEQDAVYLTKMSGIGKKTAEKIVSELAEVYEGGVEAGTAGTRSADTDVVDALMALGYSQKDARDALEKLPKEVADVNERIKLALKHIN